MSASSPPTKAGQVTLQADWSLLSGAPPTTTLRRTETITMPAASARAPDAVGAMSRALGALGERIAGRLSPRAGD